MNSADHSKRIFILWMGVGCATLSHLFLLWFPKYQELLLRDDSMSVSESEEDNTHLNSRKKFRLLVLVVTKVRSLSLFLLGLSLVANELSHIYFNGHTVVSSLLTLISKQIEPNHSNITRRHTLALHLLELALWWDEVWLTKSNPLLADNYKDLALLCAALKKSDHFKLYSKYLAELKFV